VDAIMEELRKDALKELNGEWEPASTTLFRQ
jgi:hypothetical protein